MSRFRSLRFLTSLGLTAAWFCAAPPALAQTAPPMGVLEQFSVLGNSGVTGSTGVGTTVAGDVGSSPTASISNFPPSSVTPPFVLHLTNDLTVQQAHADAISAYGFLAAQGPGTGSPPSSTEPCSLPASTPSPAEPPISQRSER